MNFWLTKLEMQAVKPQWNQGKRWLCILCLEIHKKCCWLQSITNSNLTTRQKALCCSHSLIVHNVVSRSVKRLAPEKLHCFSQKQWPGHWLLGLVQSVVEKYEYWAPLLFLNVHDDEQKAKSTDVTNSNKLTYNGLDRCEKCINWLESIYLHISAGPTVNGRVLAHKNRTILPWKNSTHSRCWAAACALGRNERRSPISINSLIIIKISLKNSNVEQTYIFGLLNCWSSCAFKIDHFAIVLLWVCCKN